MRPSPLAKEQGSSDIGEATIGTPSVVVIGDIVYDLLVEMREPLAFDTDTRARMQGRPGGAGANIAAWLARLGVETHLVARIGRDAFGRFLAGELRRDGVIAHLVEDTTEPTGKIVILVGAAGERSMIVDRGANLAIQPHDLPHVLFAPGRHLHLSGYSFFEAGPRRVALDALRRARAAGLTVSVDPASVALLRDVGAERFLAWTRGADLLFPNREEGALLGGTESLAHAAAALCAHYGGVALTLGADGAIYSGAAGESVRLPAQPARVVDTTGAGDAFSAGFLAAWLAHDAPAECLRQGLALAAQVVARLGAR